VFVGLGVFLMSTSLLERPVHVRMGPTDTGGAGAICARKISVSLFDHIFVYFVFIYFLPNVTYLLYIIACIMLWVTEISKYLQTVWDKLDIKFHTVPLPALLSVTQ